MKPIWEGIADVINRFVIPAFNLAMEAMRGMLIFINENEWVMWVLEKALIAIAAAITVNKIASLFSAMSGAIQGVTGYIIQKGGLVPALTSLKTSPGIGYGLVLVVAFTAYQEIMKQIRGLKLEIEDLDKTLERADKKRKQIMDRAWKDSNRKTRALIYNELQALEAIKGRISAMGGNTGEVDSKINELKGKLTSLEGRALGGPISAGEPYLVGEAGPEVIVPSQNGTVIPNGFGININVENRIGILAGSELAMDTLAKKIVTQADKVFKAQGRGVINA